jgi:hypothetical protein
VAVSQRSAGIVAGSSRPSCDRQLAHQRLEKISQARLCAACPVPASPSAEGHAGSRLGSGRCDRSRGFRFSRIPGQFAAQPPSALLALAGGLRW